MRPQGIPAARPILTSEERPLEGFADVEDDVVGFEEVGVGEAELAGADTRPLEEYEAADGEDRMTLKVVIATGSGDVAADATGAAVDKAL